MLERSALRALMWTLGLVRWVLSSRGATFTVFHAPVMAPVLEWIGGLRAREVFLKARAQCPAYREFLAREGGVARRPWRLSDVPQTTKENYVKRFSIEARCYGGVLPEHGVMIDESSGSSGVPNNWIRSRGERQDVKRILQLDYDLLYGRQRRILLNCFALGPWATGMNVSMSLVDVGILKSIGPDAAKVEATLRTFGPSYRYVLFGYPPFVKSLLDVTTIDLASYDIDVVVGGEGISESMRAQLGRGFKSVISSYGASDLEINLAVETQFTIALRQACDRDPALCRDLFGRDRPPMIFQYNPLDFVIGTTREGELVFTICRVDGAAPKLRYNLHDLGGTWRSADLERALRSRGVDPASLAARRSAFPLLFVFGRSDLTVAFYGAKVYPSDFEAMISAHPVLARAIRSFQFEVVEDTAANRRLLVRLERSTAGSMEEIEALALRDVVFDGLAAANQDFREVTRMFTRDALEVEVHGPGEGPFAGADVRLKSRYIGGTPASG